MNINWTVRLKNPVFWTTIIPMAVAFVYTVLGLIGVVPAIAESEVLNIFAMLIEMLTVIGVLVDPTTSGVGDSKLAMTYSAPRKDDTAEEEGL